MGCFAAEVPAQVFSLDGGAVCAALKMQPSAAGLGPRRSGVGRGGYGGEKTGEPLSDRKVNPWWPGDVLGVRQERSGGGKPQPLPFSVFSVSGCRSSFFFIFSFFPHDFWSSAEERQLYAQAAQAIGTEAAAEVTPSPAPQLLFLGARGVMPILHFQVNIPGPEPKSSLESVTVRMAV